MVAIGAELLKNLGERLKVNEPLKNHTSYKIGGPAKYFYVAESTQDLTQALQVAIEVGIPYLVLGGGTNVLINDQGFPGLVVKIKNHEWKINGTEVLSDAGVNLAFLVQKTVAKDLSGFEPLVGVPGSVGGAVYGNAGLPSLEKGCVGDWVKTITIFRQDKIIILNKGECSFSYRDSIFKHNSDIILSVVFELAKAERETIMKRVDKFMSARKTQPYSSPSCGCIFTNYKIVDPDFVRQTFAGEEKIESFIKKGQIPAGWLIEKADLKGKVLGGIQVSAEHANFLVNTGEAKAEDVIMMISYIKQQIRDKFGIQLHEEVRYLGF